MDIILTAMNLSRIFTVLLVLAAFGSARAACPCPDGELTDKISSLLVDSYDHKPVDSMVESIMRQLSRKSYLGMLGVWKSNFRDIKSAGFDPDPAVKHLLLTADRNLPPADAGRFRSMFADLSLLMLENFQMYFNAIRENPESAASEGITPGYLDDSLCVPKYYELQKSLYSREIVILGEIRTMMSDPRLKPKILIYIFIYDLLYKYRKKTIDRLLLQAQEGVNRSSRP